MSTNRLSQANREAILQCLRSGEPKSRPQIAAATELAQATVNRLVHTLVQAGLVLDAGSSTSTGGRPSLLVRFNERAAVLIAVDVADAYTELAIIDLGATVLVRERTDQRGLSPDARLAALFDIVEHGVSLAAAHGWRAFSLGVSIPGPVDDEGMIDFAPSLDWHRVPLGAMLAARFDLPNAIDNDANLIALAEHRHGARQGASSLVAVAVFSGIGAGVIVNGEVWRGFGGGAGQIGRMLLDQDGLARVYSGFGEFEQRLGSAGLAQRAKEQGFREHERGVMIDHMFRAAEAADPAAEAFISEVLDEFAVALINVCAILDPELMVFAGIFASWADLVLPGLRRRMVGQVLHMPTLATVSVEHAALIGAADIAFERAGAVRGLLSAM